eukprot:3440606-Rhodomonas_salina.1
MPKCSAATLAGLKRAKCTEAKFQLVDQLFQEELEEGYSLPPSNVESEEEIECSPGTLFIDAVHTRPYADQLGRRIFLCEVGMMDEDGEWHDSVSWELPEHSIHKRVLSDFLCLPMAEVFSVLLIADWSRLSPKDSVDAGVPMADAMGKRKLPRRKPDSDLAGVFYQLARGSAEKEQCEILSTWEREARTASFWEAVTSVVLLGGKSAVLSSEVKQCLQIMQHSFWDDALGDLQGYLQICWVLVGAGADSGGNIAVAGISHLPSALYGSKPISALGHKWVLRRPHCVHYNQTSEMHTFSRSTGEFVPLFSVDLNCIQNRKAPPGQENNQ